VPAIKQTNICPLVQAESPEPNEFINFTGLTLNTVHANDFFFYEEVDELVQEEPVEALDSERTGQLTAVGIVKGRPFAPDDRMPRIPDQAAAIGGGMAGRPPTPRVSRTRRCAAHGRTSSWAAATSSRRRPAARRSHPVPLSRDRDHPGDAPRAGWAGSAYAHAVHDVNGDLFDGATTYRLHVDPDPPARTSGPSTSTTPRPAR
jgi:hypothetical protein